MVQTISFSKEKQDCRANAKTFFKTRGRSTFISRPASLVHHKTSKLAASQSLSKHRAGTQRSCVPDQQTCCSTKLVKTKGQERKKVVSKTSKLAASQSLSKQRAGAQRSSVPDQKHKAQAGLVEKRFAFFLVVEPGLDVTNLGSDATNITC